MEDIKINDNVFDKEKNLMTIYKVQHIFGDFAIIKDKEGNIKRQLIWLLESVKNNRKKKINRIKEYKNEN